MPTSELNAVKLLYEKSGTAGEPLVFVHGSWTDHHSWDLILPSLADEFSVVTYDRRGHSGSDRPPGPGTVIEDVSDLQMLVKQLGWKPAHFIGNSFGGTIVLKLAATRPDLFKSLSVHEPPLFGLLDPSILDKVAPRVEGVLNLIRAGDMQTAARTFVETVAIGPGGWETLTPEMRETCIFNAPTFLDEQEDPEWLTIDLERLANFSKPVMLTRGDQSPPFLLTIVEKLSTIFKRPRVVTIAGAGHIPQTTHPDEYSALIRNFINSVA